MTFILTPQKPPYYETAPGGIVIGSYKAILNQTGTDNPIATVLQNTFGKTIVWERISLGIYSAFKNFDETGGDVGGFLPNKTWIQVSQAGPFILMATQISPENTVTLSSYDASGVLVEGLDAVSIHIILFK